MIIISVLMILANATAVYAGIIPKEFRKMSRQSVDEQRRKTLKERTKNNLDKQQLETQFQRNVLDPKEARKQYKQQKAEEEPPKPEKKEPEPKPEQEQSFKEKFIEFWQNPNTLETMNFTQLLQRKNELIVEGNYQIALKYLERMLPLSDTPEQLIYIMLEMAELYMKIGDCSRAERMFMEFCKLYPGNEYVEQAFVKAIECSYTQTSNPDRDQTKTELTLDLIDEFLTRETIYTQESLERVRELQAQCRNKLAQREMGIARFYIGRSSWGSKSSLKSAHRRIDGLHKDYLKLLPDLEPELLQLEIELAQAEENDEHITHKKQELNEKFPNHPITIALNTDKKSWITRI